MCGMLKAAPAKKAEPTVAPTISEGDKALGLDAQKNAKIMEDLKKQAETGKSFVPQDDSKGGRILANDGSLNGF